MKNKEKLLFVIFVVLGSLMFCDATLMFLSSQYRYAVKDILFGVAFGIVGFIYLLSSKKDL